MPKKKTKQKEWAQRIYWFEKGKWYYRSFDLLNKDFERKLDEFLNANGYRVYDVKYDGRKKIVFCISMRFPKGQIHVEP